MKCLMHEEVRLKQVGINVTENSDKKKKRNQIELNDKKLYKQNTM